MLCYKHRRPGLVQDFNLVLLDGPLLRNGVSRLALDTALDQESRATGQRLLTGRAANLEG